MVFKRLHLGTVSYGTDTMDEIQNHLVNAYTQVSGPSPAGISLPVCPVLLWPRGLAQAELQRGSFPGNASAWLCASLTYKPGNSLGTNVNSFSVV